jgi:hypothetical protein
VPSLDSVRLLTSRPLSEFPRPERSIRRLLELSEQSIHLVIGCLDQISDRSLQSQDAFSLESITGSLPITLELLITSGSLATPSNPFLVDREHRCRERAERDTNEPEHSV